MHLLRLLIVGLLGATGLTACTTPAEEPPMEAASLAPTVITPFAGYWEGTTEVGTATERAATVLIEEGPDGSFTITWRNLAAANDADAAEPLTTRDATLTFEPGDEAGIWQAVGSSDIADGGMQSWAELQGDGMLVVHIQSLMQSGEVEHQTYSRRVAGDEMTLEYIRRLDEVPNRVIHGTFIRTGAA